MDILLCDRDSNGDRTALLMDVLPQAPVAIRINDQWRICLRFANGGALNVEIVDDH